MTTATAAPSAEAAASAATIEESVERAVTRASPVLVRVRTCPSPEARIASVRLVTRPRPRAAALPTAPSVVRAAPVSRDGRGRVARGAGGVALGADVQPSAGGGVDAEPPDPEATQRGAVDDGAGGAVDGGGRRAGTGCGVRGVADRPGVGLVGGEHREGAAGDDVRRPAEARLGQAGEQDGGAGGVGGEVATGPAADGGRGPLRTGGAAERDVAAGEEGGVEHQDAGGGGAAHLGVVAVRRCPSSTRWPRG